MEGNKSNFVSDEDEYLIRCVQKAIEAAGQHELSPEFQQRVRWEMGFDFPPHETEQESKE